MQNWSRKVLCAVVLAALVALLVPALAAAATPGQYIVTFDGPDHAAAAKQIAKLGGAKVKDLWIIDGAVFKLPSKTAAGKVRALAGVKTVELDVIQYAYKGKPVPQPPAESLPWGVDKFDADVVWTSYLLRGAGVNVGIIDTGIDMDHPELAANVKGGWNCIAETANFDDDNGHGSHVAGTVAGIDNTIGVIGVAPSANLYGIKVLNRSGRGTTSDIIEGMPVGGQSRHGRHQHEPRDVVLRRGLRGRDELRPERRRDHGVLGRQLRTGRGHGRLSGGVRGA